MYRVAVKKTPVGYSMTFFTSRPATGNFFYGHSEEISLIRGNHSLCFIGPRRIGKTSLFRHLTENRPEHNWTCYYFDCAVLDPRKINLTDFLSRLMRGLRRSCRGFECQSDDPIEQLQTFIAEHPVGRVPVFFWDETERLMQMEKNEPGAIQGLGGIFRNAGEVRVYTTHGPALWLNPYPRHEALLTILEGGNVCFLGGLDPFETRKMLGLEHHQLEYVNKIFNPDDKDQAIAHFVDWSGGHPSLLSSILGVFEGELRQGNKISLSTLDELKSSVCNKNNRQEAIWSDMAATWVQPVLKEKFVALLGPDTWGRDNEAVTISLDEQSELELLLPRLGFVKPVQRETGTYVLNFQFLRELAKLRDFTGDP